MIIINVLIKLMVCIVEFMIFSQFFDNYLERKYASDRHVMTGAGLVILLTCINILEVDVVNSVAGVLLSFVFCALLYNGTAKLKLILVGTINLILIASEVIAIYVDSALTQLPFEVLQINNLHMLAMITISKAMALIIVRIIILAFPYKRASRIKYNAIVFLVYPMMAIINILTLQYIEFKVGFSQNVLLILAALSMAVLLSGITVMMAYDSTIEKQKLENLLQINEQRQQSIELLYRASERFAQESKYIMHDCKNQMQSIKYQYQTHNPQADKRADELMCRLDSVLQQHTININNEAVSSIISRIGTQCKYSFIKFEINIGPCDLSFLDFLDSSSIFDNALDNAISACRKFEDEGKRQINLTIFTKANFTVIKVCNTRCNQIVDVDGELKSEKEDSAGHGLGLKSVKAVANKYGGDASWEYDDTNFTLTVYLNGNNSKSTKAT